jgi:hypothetical protein
MFSEAYELASQYTWPVIITSKTIDDVVSCSGGSFVIINDDGWFITVAHIFDLSRILEDNEPLMSKYNQEVFKIQQDNSLTEADKVNKINKLEKDPNWLTDLSYWWGMDEADIENVVFLEENDLVIGRLTNFDLSAIKSYPVFKNPEKIKPGTSLCKLGFPFHDISATYNAENHNFELCEDAVPVPLFPIEGIYTRDNFEEDPATGKVGLFLETSSPGLPGQSGGPIFDTKGNVWAIQSKTRSFLLEFGTETEQYFNVGLGVHPKVIVDFLRQNDIKFNISD